MVLADLGLLIVDGLAIDGGDAGTDGRDFLRAFAGSLFDHSRNIGDLAFLNIDEDHTRQTAVACEVEFPHQIGLHDLHRDHDKRSEADGEQNYSRLIARPVE